MKFNICNSFLFRVVEERLFLKIKFQIGINKKKKGELNI